MRNAATTKEVYEKLLAMPDLHSLPNLEGDILIWRIYENAYIQAYCNSNETCIDIISDSVYLGSLTRWHPNADDMPKELYVLGKKGNILVIKKSLFGASVFYSGDPAQYPLSEIRGWDFGKKKYDFGTLIYLEQKQ